MLDFLNSSALRIAVFLLIALVLLAGVYATRARSRRLPSVDAGNLIPPEPEVASQPKDPIAVLDFDEDPGSVPIYKSRIVIGRHREDDVKLNDIRVSRHHALLLHSDSGAFEIHNQTAGRSEPNDLLVNGVYREHARLADGDKVTVGGVSFIFRAPGTVPAHAI